MLSIESPLCRCCSGHTEHALDGQCLPCFDLCEDIDGCALDSLNDCKCGQRAAASSRHVQGVGPVDVYLLCSDCQERVHLVFAAVDAVRRGIDATQRLAEETDEETAVTVASAARLLARNMGDPDFYPRFVNATRVKLMRERAEMRRAS